MTFKDFLADGVQTSCHPALEEIAETWTGMLDPAVLEGMTDETFHPRMAAFLEGEGPSEAVKLQIAGDLERIAVLRGPAPPESLRGRVGAVARPILAGIADTLVLGRRTLPFSRLRRAHVLLVGDLEGPGHSPTETAIDYAATLAMDPNVDRLEIVYSGFMTLDMAGYIRERLGGLPRERGISLVSTLENDGFLADILGRGPCTFHMVSEPTLSPVISVVSRLGPTLMHTSADIAPVQYADVYWSGHSGAYIEQLWRRQEAPEAFARNHVQVLSGPWREAPPPAPVTRAEIGAPDDAIIIATVGDHLGAELDEAYITGVELAVRDRPHCIWMVVGDLPGSLSNACRQVLGDQFLHFPDTGQMERLMGAVDIYANPFRGGGGRSARMAARAGAILLSLNQGDAATAVPEDIRASDPEDVFRRLDMLIESVELREACRAYQTDYIAKICDQRAFRSSLSGMITLAAKRYAARLGGLPLSQTVFAASGALAAAS